MVKSRLSTAAAPPQGESPSTDKTALVIVESPAKARTINRYLGPGFRVESSVGHVRDLPARGSGRRADADDGPAADPQEKAWRALVRRMGVDPKSGWEARYQILPEKRKTVEALRRLADEADAIYLATDLDREGEAIAWHLREVLGSDPGKYRRAVFNEITDKAIAEAFRKPVELNMDRVRAQQARRFLDRVVGFMVSPLLWEKIARGLSAGRVQSVALRLVVEREREIAAFQSEEFWNLFAELSSPRSARVTMQVVRHRGRRFRPGCEAEAAAARAELRAASYRVSARQDKPGTTAPPAPLITSTLQQAAHNRLGFSVRQAMASAQRLYEAGHITYMRTDSTNLSDESVAACRAHIVRVYGDAYLPKSPNRYRSRANAQEAHEAIRPTDVSLLPARVAAAKPQDARLYELVWRHFVACQMTPLRYTAVTLLAEAGDYALKANGRTLDFDGFSRVLERPVEDQTLPELSVGESLSLNELRAEQRFTQPPPRYNEASLVREMEKRGVGRPSTYASIISTICDRGYVRVDSRRLHAEKIGQLVVDRLNQSFEDLMDYGFTAAMEGDLDKVANGELNWRELLDRFYVDFERRLVAAESAMPPNRPMPVDGLHCPDCGRPMVVRTAATGMFLGCTGYRLPKEERCSRTIDLSPPPPLPDANDEARRLSERSRCERCGAAMEVYAIDDAQRLHLCGDYPNCASAALERGEFGPSDAGVAETIDCDRCGALMQARSGRYGRYFACIGDNCGNTRKVLADGRVAPPRSAPVPMPELRCARVDDHFVLRDGAAGLFLSASQFPRHRETRAPLVAELLAHRGTLDDKFAHLCHAPPADPDGLPAVVRFDRRRNEHYVRTERDGKPTGWSARWSDGRWETESAPVRRAPPRARAKGAPGKTAGARRHGGPGKTAGARRHGGPGKAAGARRHGAPGKAAGDRRQGAPGKAAGDRRQGAPGKAGGDRRQGAPGKAAGDRRQGAPGKAGGARRHGAPAKAGGARRQGASTGRRAPSPAGQGVQRRKRSGGSPARR